MSIFNKLWKEGWFNPNLDLDLDIKDINLNELKEKGSTIVQKQARIYRISIPKDKSLNDLKEQDVEIEELPGVYIKKCEGKK